MTVGELEAQLSLLVDKNKTIIFADHDEDRYYDPHSILIQGEGPKVYVFLIKNRR